MLKLHETHSEIGAVTEGKAPEDCASRHNDDLIAAHGAGDGRGHRVGPHFNRPQYRTGRSVKRKDGPTMTTEETPECGDASPPMRFSDFRGVRRYSHTAVRPNPRPPRSPV